MHGITDHIRADDIRVGRYLADEHAIHKVVGIDGDTITMRTVFELTTPDVLPDSDYGPTADMSNLERFREPTEEEFNAYLRLADPPLAVVPDHAITVATIEGVAQAAGDGTIDCHVYLGSEIVWSSTGHPAAEFPAGLDDASGWAVKSFAKRLAVMLAQP